MNSVVPNRPSFARSEHHALGVGDAPVGARGDVGRSIQRLGQATADRQVELLLLPGVVGGKSLLVVVGQGFDPAAVPVWRFLGGEAAVVALQDRADQGVELVDISLSHRVPRRR